MNYRQVAEIICRILGWGFLTSGLAAIGGSYAYYSRTGISGFTLAASNILLMFFAGPLSALCVGIAVCVLAKPLAATLVPSAKADHWNPTVLVLSSIGLVAAVNAVQSTAPLVISVLVERSSNTGNIVSTPALAFVPYGIAGFLGLFLWLILPQLYAGKLSRQKISEVN